MLQGTFWRCTVCEREQPLQKHEQNGAILRAMRELERMVERLAAALGTVGNGGVGNDGDAHGVR